MCQSRFPMCPCLLVDVRMCEEGGGNSIPRSLVDRECHQRWIHNFLLSPKKDTKKSTYKGSYRRVLVWIGFAVIEVWVQQYFKVPSESGFSMSREDETW